MSGGRVFTDDKGKRHELRRITDGAARPTDDDIARLLDELDARGRAARAVQGDGASDAGSTNETAETLAEVYGWLAARGRSSRSQ